MPRLAGGLLARAVARFQLDHPGVVVAIHSGDDEAVNEWIATGFCDAAMTMVYGAMPAADLDHVLTLDCVAVLPLGHPLANRPLLTVTDLRGEPFIAASLGSALRDRIDGMLAAAGTEVSVTAEAGLGSAICALVAAGLGISVMNPLAAYEEALVSPIAIRPIAPALPVHFALLFPRIPREAVWRRRSVPARGRSCWSNSRGCRRTTPPASARVRRPACPPRRTFPPKQPSPSGYPVPRSGRRAAPPTAGPNR